MFLKESLVSVEKMPEDSLENIVAKYVEMNAAHPFYEGNGRSTRIRFDLILKNLGKCVGWSKIEKREYLAAMKKSPVDATGIFLPVSDALTMEIDDREIFMKGIDSSYYYEERRTNLSDTVGKRKASGNAETFREQKDAAMSCTPQKLPDHFKKRRSRPAVPFR